jgi:hypothetical protein
MVRAFAWLLNLDADDELARPKGYSLSSATSRRSSAQVERLKGLFGPGDLLVPDKAPRGSCAGHRGRAWCPTPRALRTLAHAGALVPPAPPLDVLRAVNHRRFNAALGQTLPGARFAFTEEEVTATLAQPSPTGTWLLKRPFGFAGRGRRKVNPDRPGDLRHAQAWIEASLRAGEGLQVEPLVDRAADYGLHGFVRPDGRVVLGHPTRQECDKGGAWLGSARAAADLHPDERDALHEEAHRAAAALHQAGYFGPFGIDAFRWRDASGHRRWNARVEINARYSMGWAIGMGDERPDLEDA